MPEELILKPFCQYTSKTKGNVRHKDIYQNLIRNVDRDER
jgi:hypothetical protein